MPNPDFISAFGSEADVDRLSLLANRDADDLFRPFATVN